MAVVVIIGIMGAVGMYSVSKSDTQPSVAALSRSVQMLLMRARLEALADHHARQVQCSKNQCKYFIFSDTTSTFLDAGEAINTGSGARAIVWNVTTTLDQTVNNGGASAFAGTGIITFNTNGTATPSTVYLSDTQGKRAFYKIYVYGATGMARMVANW